MLDEADIRVSKFDSCEGVAGCEDCVVERVGGVGSGFVEELREVRVEGWFVG